MSPEYGKSYSAFIDEGKLTGGLFYFQRERDRVQAGPGQDGKYHSNLSHATTQAALNFNSGYAWGVVGVDVGGFGAYDLAVDESNGVNEENEFSFWGDKWGSGGDGVPENGFSLSNAALKFKFGDAVTAKGGYTQLYVPGILGVNWSYQPGTYRGGQIEGTFGGLYLTYAIADEYKAPGSRTPPASPRAAPMPAIPSPMRTRSTTSTVWRSLHLRERHCRHRRLLVSPKATWTATTSSWPTSSTYWVA